MLEVTVAIPWRPTPERQPAFKRIQQFWKHHAFNTVTADSDPHKPFNLSQARNQAVRKTTTPKIILADADVIPDIANIHVALQNDGVTYPFTIYRHIPSEWATHSDLLAAPIDHQYGNSCAGVWVLNRETYWNIGGFDEHFTGWGYEDNAFYAAAQTLSTIRRLSGYLFSFNHPATRDTTATNPNRPRYELYRYASGRPDVMRALIKR